MFEGLILPKKVRVYLYPVALAAIALLVSYGVLAEAEAALWGSLVAAVLGLGVAQNHIVEGEAVKSEKAAKKGTQEYPENTGEDATPLSEEESVVPLDEGYPYTGEHNDYYPYGRR